MTSLCTPKHYFEFVPARFSGRIAIIGGGAWSSFAVEVAGRLAARHRALWGVGRSIRFDRDPSDLDFAALEKLFDKCSTRDPESATKGNKPRTLR